MNKYYTFFSTNGTQALPCDDCEVYFTVPLTFIPPNYIFTNIIEMQEYFQANPDKLIENQIFKVIDINRTLIFYKYDGFNIVDCTSEFYSNKIDLLFINIFAQATSLKVYFNNDKKCFLTIASNDNEGLEGLEIDHLYVNNVAGTTLEIHGMR